MFTVQTPYFMALTACKMVLRAASEDLQHLLLCASEYDQSPFCFFFFLHFPSSFFQAGFSSTEREQGKDLDFHRSDQGCMYRATPQKGHFTQLKQIEENPTTKGIYAPSAMVNARW